MSEDPSVRPEVLAAILSLGGRVFREELLHPIQRRRQLIHSPHQEGLSLRPSAIGADRAAGPSPASPEALSAA